MSAMNLDLRWIQGQRNVKKKKIEAAVWTLFRCLYANVKQVLHIEMQSVKCQFEMLCVPWMGWVRQMILKWSSWLTGQVHCPGGRGRHLTMINDIDLICQWF